MKGVSIAGLICAIAGLAFSFLGIFIFWLALAALPLSIVGLILSVNGGKKAKALGESNGAAKAGLIIGIIATVFSAITFAFCGICGLCVFCAEDAVLDGLNGALSDLENSLK